MVVIAQFLFLYPVSLFFYRIFIFLYSRFLGAEFVTDTSFPDGSAVAVLTPVGLG